MTDEKKYMYCTKCKKKTLTTNLGTRISKNNRLMITGYCSSCLTKKQEFAATKKSTESANGNINFMEI